VGLSLLKPDNTALQNPVPGDDAFLYRLHISGIFSLKKRLSREGKPFIKR